MAVKEAKLVLQIATEFWGPERRSFWGRREKSWCYGIDYVSASWHVEIVVDENSGEDGAPAPSLMFRIDPTQPFPATLSALEGMSLQDHADKWSEGWYGNDAPRLFRNCLGFGPWVDRDRIVIHWSAQYDDWFAEPRAPATMQFDGPMEFKGIRMNVKEDGDAGVFLAKALPSLDMQSVELAWEPWQDFGKHMPADRRRWHPAIWKTKR
jgi:hypothetical protein